MFGDHSTEQDADEKDEEGVSETGEEESSSFGEDRMGLLIDILQPLLRVDFSLFLR
jgi:hypothetical protein